MDLIYFTAEAWNEGWQGLITAKHICLDYHSYWVTTYQNNYTFQVHPFLCAESVSTNFFVQDSVAFIANITVYSN